ncbi:tetratricopeptide repeat protein [Neobacillus pocheonensis]|uniref:Tetratricopeptide repeat protein n=1 Tax=Neobacillus pocheonensis TaxID=363869 RepID=A0ABT0W5N2_9BACI|nr:tetratricopeptide repeat protein [Neobacillus pocheonensis]
MIVILFINLVFDFSASGIDNAGHLGGIAGGFLAAGIVHFPKKKKPLLQLLFLVSSIAIVWGSLAYGYSSTVRAQDESSNLMLAQEYINQSNYDQAYNVLNKFVKVANKPSEKVYFLLSFAEIKKGLFPEAKTHLQKAIQLNPNFDQAYFNIALIYLDENNFKQAKVNAVKAAKLKPDEKKYSDLVNEINQHL